MVLKSIEFKMVLECIIVDGSSDGLGMHRRVFSGRFAILFKLLRVGHHKKNV